MKYFKMEDKLKTVVKRKSLEIRDKVLHKPSPLLKSSSQCTTKPAVHSCFSRCDFIQISRVAISRSANVILHARWILRFYMSHSSSS